MTNYALYNKKLNKKLIHPRVGVWYTTDLEDAKKTLAACHEYLEAIGAENEREHFIIINLETSEEIT